jgi:GTPase SAR1 family protein
MGMCGIGSGTNHQTPTTVIVNRDIEIQRQNMKDEVKLLFLGPGESGKSTIFKQFKLLFGSGFTEHEKEGYRRLIHANIIGQMKTLVEASIEFKIDIVDGKQNKTERILEKLSDENWTEDLALMIKELWNDTGIQKVYGKRSEFQLNDSTKYFMENIDRVMSSDYIPTSEDILRSRIRTAGAVEERFVIDDFTFRMIDVGGQRAERRKWLPCLSDVTSVLFIVGISEYDQKLREDSNQNRITESILLFDQVCNSSYFKTTNFILFFNKVDIFKEKLETTDLSVLFPTYEGGADLEKAKMFIVNRFLEKNQSPHEIYYHFTCAVDTESFLSIFTAVKEFLIADVMRKVEHL